MPVRFKYFVLVFLSFAICVFPSTAPQAANEKGAKPRFFSFEKSMETYSVYRHYLDSIPEDIGLAKDGRLRMRMEISGLFISPGRLSEDIMTQLFRLERHFAREIAGNVPDYKVEDVYGRENMRELQLGDKQVSLLKDMIKSQLYFEDPRNIENAEKFLEAAVINKQSERAGKEKPIPLEDLKIKESKEDVCLASAPDIGCLVSVREFNAYLPYADGQTGRTLAEAREHILRFYAFQKLKTLKGREEAIDVDKKAVVQHVKEVQEYRRMRESLMGMGLPVVDEKSLQAAYQKHYREHFAERDSAVLKILASSDSAYADSIHRFLNEHSKKRSLSNKKPVSDTDYALPWITFNEKDLPIELVAPTDTFYEGEYSEPIKTNAGYFLVKLSRICRIPFIPFEKAQSMCIFLATRDKYSGLDSVLTAKAKKYYYDHPDEFLTPDTSSYRFWLVPPNRYRNIRQYAGDTAHIKSMVKQDTDLPRSVTKKLNSKTIPDSLRMHMVDTKYGQMLVKLITVKKGGIKIPFAKAKKEIVGILIKNPLLQPASYAKSIPQDSVMSQEVLFTLGASDLIFSAIIDETRSISDSEIEAAIKSGQIDVSDLNPQAKNGRFYQAARKKLEFSRIDKKHEEIQSQLKDIQFDMGALSSN